ncbi:hypothetical protein WICMUC_005226 [Wickerhamomyces mucosus]|uniref:Uncharacterized protein n=1 Tax=Wickerhamomyces mucosus TaxID=1378264 RepID=A0A9P8P9W3_9ASCO|nr:hypothetical protein WICMUC_005226 [Wickerhamomyces mucosus]
MKFSTITLSIVTILISSSFAHGIHRSNIDISSNEEINIDNIDELFYSNGDLNLLKLYSQLDNCDIITKLNDLIKIQSNNDQIEEISTLQYIFSQIFPFENPIYNSILATTYISTLPTFLLTFFSSSINPSSLNLLVSFAAGGILGDVFFHLLPQCFLGESIDHNKHSFVLVDEKRNTLLGLFIFIGFIFFFIIDKSLRILQHGTNNEHNHSHLQDYDLKIHKKTDGDDNNNNNSININLKKNFDNSAYLNIISDFTHNITDGLAMSTSFFMSKTTGSITCLGQVIHEIPHQVGDMALLIQGGFSKWQAIGVQFFTASGAFIGTFIGIQIQQWAKTGSNEIIGNESPGLFGTSVTTGDLTLPFTAGGFIYVATVNVIPEILELQSNNSKRKEFSNGILQIFFIFLGIGMMFLVSWFE